MLYIGYFLIGIAIIIGTFILVYQAYGFGIARNGEVIQNGLAFFSSQPNPADIYVDGVKESARTNTRLPLESGIYDIQLKRSGYRTWQRKINLEGGRVAHFDYPLLFAKVLTPKKVDSYTPSSGFSTQSPDHRWLLVQQANSISAFNVYDLKNPVNATAPISVPTTVFTKALGSENIQAIEWANDNQHLLLLHNYDGKTEYIVLDRASPEKSINLNTTLAINPSKLTLRDKKYDLYYMFDQSTGALQTVSLGETAPVTVLQKVINYQSYGKDALLYATDVDAPAGKVSIKLQRGNNVYKIRNLSAGSNYLLDLTGYSGKMYVAVGAVSENKLYIYKDPIGQLNKLPGYALLPAQVLRVTSPNYLSFSSNAQFIMIENGTEFAVYDIENKLGHRYLLKLPLDPPQKHVTWMDGHRMTYVSGGKLIVFDYDNANVQSLISADSRYEAAFTPDYKFVYSLSSSATQTDMTQTSLLTPADQ